MAPWLQSPRSSPRYQGKGEKKFPCPVPNCDAGYSRRVVLFRHFHAKHGHLINMFPDMRPQSVKVRADVDFRVCISP